MTTAQLTGRINLDLCHDGAIPVAGPRTRKRTGTKTAGATRSGGGLAAVIPTVAGRLERRDTLADRLVGYGVCGLTMFYLAGHVLKALFS